MIQWTEAGGMTEVVSPGENANSETFSELMSDLMGTCGPEYAAEVIEWWFTNRNATLVMACGDLWEWLGNE
jgi:hypothetical protein